MSSKYGISKEQYAWLKKILNTYLPGLKVHVFGSRARGDHKKYSDLDLAIESEKQIASKTLMELQEQFAASSLPFKVDLVELQKIEPDFRKNIQGDLRGF